MANGVGISDVAMRVGEIRVQIATRIGRATSAPALEGSGPADPLSGFDPFGTAYQQALAAASPFANQAGPNQTGPIQTGQESGFTVGGGMRISTVGTAYATRRSGPTSMETTVGQIGGYGSMPVPAALASYGNGALPSSELESIGQGGHRLYTPAAEAWKQAVAAAKADGIDLKVTDSYRSYYDQVELASRKGLYADGGLAATPGTSNHGWGLAVDADVTGPAALQWLQDNGHRFGFVQAVPREPWHWEFRPAQA